MFSAVKSANSDPGELFIVMVIIIKRTANKHFLPCKGKNYSAVFQIAEENGFRRIDPLDIENEKEIRWHGIEFNRLYERSGILYRFNEWIGEYPYCGVIMEEIGIVK